MKRKTTKEILADSFRELAVKKPVDKITVQEIVDNCDYSPATFYRHFKDKYDLIAWGYVHETNEIMARVGTDEYQWQNTWADGIKYYRKNKEYIQNLLRNTSGHDAFVRHMAKANVEHLTKCILKLTGQKALDADSEIYVQIYCYGTVQTVCEWLADGIDCDGERLAELFVLALPEPLKPLLMKQ